MQQNKIRSYILYAIGEIVLVMIGILLALQVNNWNEQRIENNQLNEYLQSIKTNVQTDIIKLKSDAIKRDTLRAGNRRAYENINAGIYDLSELKRAERFFYEFYFTPNRSGFQSLTNSGYIGKLANTRLDSLLSNYYIGLDQLREREISYNTFIENVEFEFRTFMNPIRYRELLVKDSLTYKEEEELKEYYKSNIFQAGVLRAASQPNDRYYSLVENGELIIQEIDSLIN